MGKERFYQKTWFIILMLIIFAPIGLFLMWKYKTWGKAAKIIVTVVFCFVFIRQISGVAGGGNSSYTDSTNQAVADAQSSEKKQATEPKEQATISQVQSTQPVQKETKSEPATPAIKTYNDGMYKIGSDIGAGEYLIVSNGTAGYYELASDSTGNLESIISNDTFSGTRYLTVKNGEYLTLKMSNMIAVADATPTDTSSGELSDGMYKVGFDIPAGEYKVHSDSEGYIEVTTDSTGQLSSIVSNDNFQGDKYVTVTDGQYLTLVGCTLALK